MVFCPEQLLRVILAHIHYMPDHWQGNAHRYETRDQFSQLFQYKAVSMKTEQRINIKTTIDNCKEINLSEQCIVVQCIDLWDSYKCIQAIIHVITLVLLLL